MVLGREFDQNFSEKVLLQISIPELLNGRMCDVRMHLHVFVLCVLIIN